MAQEGAAPEGAKTVSQALAIVLAIVLLVVGIGVGYGIGFVVIQPTERTADTLLEEIYLRGHLIVGTDAAFPPFENVNPDTGDIEGFDIDLITAIAEVMGLDVEIRNIGWDPLFTAIPDKTLDLGISAMTITEERRNTFLFSEPYFRSNLTVIIRDGGPMEGVIDSVDDLDGRSIAYQEFTTSEGWVADELEGTMGFTVTKTATTLFTDAVQLLLADEVDAVIIDSPVAEGYQAAGSVIIVDTIITDEKFGIPMPLGEVALKGAVDAALAELVADGTYDDIFDEWFGP